MKHVILFVLMLGASTPLFAQQLSKNAIGIRISESRAIGAEVNYQRAIMNNNRLEFGLGLRRHSHYDVSKLTGLFEWVWHIDGNFNWYVGPGLGLGSVNFDHHHHHHHPNDRFFAYATGVVGIEYYFDFPLLLSFDFRPEIDFGGVRDDVNFDIGISARYQF
jgi:hypothetical protein